MIFFYRCLTKVAHDPCPDRPQVLQRLKIRLITVEADLIVPLEKPSVERDGLDEPVLLDEPLRMEEHDEQEHQQNNSSRGSFTYSKIHQRLSRRRL